MFKSRATGFWCVLACTRRVSLSTSVEMIGDGDLVKWCSRRRAVMSRCSRRVMGRIANLTLRQGGGKGIWFGDIAQGASPFRGMRHHESKHRMRRNPLRSRSRLLRNRIHNGKMLASMWTTTARGPLEDNDIFGNAFSAVEIKME
jgi:hypothetical protein